MRSALAILLLLFAADNDVGRERADSGPLGRFHAQLADYRNGVAYLQKPDGRILSLPVERLSGTDQEFIWTNFPAVRQATGKVVGVTDGDTVTVLEGSTQHKVRLEGIDAPESHQAFGAKSRHALSEKVFQKNIAFEWHEKDRYGRLLAHLFLDDRWINKELVDEGWAWHFRKYSKSPVLELAEQEARKAHRGLWADSNPTAPWDYRDAPTPVAPKSEPGKREAKPSSNRARAPPTDDDVASSDPTVYVTRTGQKYHVDGCRHLKSRIPMPLSEAIKRYTPCKTCHPPTADTVASIPTTPTVSSYSSGGPVHVKGYYRKDGTYVRPHTRSRPRR